MSEGLPDEVGIGRGGTITATMLIQDERGSWLPPLHTSQQLPFPNLIFFYSSLLLLYIVNDPTLKEKT